MNKGQIFSLDFIIAAGVVLLALAVVINSIESVSFNSSTMFYQDELQYVAMTAGDRFISSASPCKYNGVNVKNCVYMNLLWVPSAKINKTKLGIPDEYSYTIKQTEKRNYFDGISAEPEDKSVYSITRIYLQAGSLNPDLSSLTDSVITFRVWKT
ncbi:MAG: hypothetical protein JW703_03530 [Candidatus Diapherotrites archaeon]|nr:hypothetical protein [Candidatus Diapherotrites archaeon]